MYYKQKERNSKKESKRTAGEKKKHWKRNEECL